MRSAALTSFVPLCLSLLVPCAGAAPPPTGPVDVPAPETAVWSPAVPSHERGATLLPLGGEDALLFALSNEQLVVARSDDGGAHYGSPVMLLGQPGLPVRAFSVARGPAGLVGVAAEVASMEGGFDLQFVASRDGGGSWGGVVTIVPARSAVAPVPWSTRPPVLALGPKDLAAVLYATGPTSGEGFYVASSADDGTTWRPNPVRVDPGGTGARDEPFAGFTMITGPTNKLHVLYIQARGSQSRALYTMSDEDWASFGPEVDLAAQIVPSPLRSVRGLDLVAGSDGSLIAAMAESGRHVIVGRSPDGVLPFALQADVVATGTGIGAGGNVWRVALATAPGTKTVIAAFTSDATSRYGQIEYVRSANNGIGFGPVTLLAPAADRSAWPVFAYTPAGTWATAVADPSFDSYGLHNADIRVRTSVDEGLTWGSFARVATVKAGSTATEFTRQGLAAAAKDAVLLAWADGRAASDQSNDVYAVRGDAATATFDADVLVPVENAGAAAATNHATIASDGAGTAYTASAVRVDGPYADIYVASSGDAGYTWRAPVRVGSWPKGSQMATFPRLAARPGGTAHVIFQLANPVSGERELRVSTTHDYGATWSPDMGLGTIDATDCPAWSWTCWEPWMLDAQVAVTPSGVALVAWTDGAEIHLARSTDGGLTWSSHPMSGTANRPTAPQLATDGIVTVLAYQADYEGEFPQLVALTSLDAGATWSATVLYDGVNFEYLDPSRVACDGQGHALVTWTDTHDAGESVFAARWGGSGWTTLGNLSTPGRNETNARPVFAGTNALVTWESNDGFGDIWAVWSDDGGVTFSAPRRLDDVMERPDDISTDPRPVSDGVNVWVTWIEFRGTGLEIVARHSGDGGESFEPHARRIDREQPRRVARNLYDMAPPTAVLRPGALGAAWNGERGPFPMWLYNVYDIADMDRDGVPAAADCADTDNGAWAIPSEVTDLQVGASGARAWISWASQAAAAGNSTMYEVLSGPVAGLLAQHGFGDAQCLGSRTWDTSVLDAPGNPAPGDARWYLARATNICGYGGFGDSSQRSDPRDVLDQRTPCP